MTRTPAYPIVRADTLPDGVTYEDEGCSVASACLQCPLPACVYDQAGHSESLAKRDAEIVSLKRRGIKPGDIAKAMGISERTVHRSLKQPAPPVNRGGAFADQPPTMSLAEYQARRNVKARRPLPSILRGAGQ